MEIADLLKRLNDLGVKKLYIDTEYGEGRTKVFIECMISNFKDCPSYLYRSQTATLRMGLARIIELQSQNDSNQSS